MTTPQGDDPNLFASVFGCSLRPYWDMMAGFDVIRFDVEIAKPRDGESCAMAVRRQYGQEAVDLIRSLIG